MVARSRGSSRRWRYAAGWLLATAAALLVGVVAVTTVGDSIRDRGPLGNEVVRSVGLAAPASPDPDLPVRTETVRGEFGSFVVACQGVFALGVDARPDRSAGWQVVSYEPGPDDDVDAVFRNGARSIELEVFCNRGRPTLAELERHSLPDPD